MFGTVVAQAFGPARKNVQARRPALLLLAVAATLSAQPGQLLGPAQQSAMQDSSLKPALPGSLLGVGIDQKLDALLPLDVQLRDEYGRDVKLREYFHAGKPV